MANPTRKLTVADLEAAKNGHEKMANINAPHNELFGIAATCIGIVKEMVKTAKSQSYYEKDVTLWNVYNKAVAAFGGEVK